MVYVLSDILNLHLKESVRVKVKKYDERGRVEYYKFTLEPQLTSFEALQNFLAEKSKTNREFAISYQATRNGRDDYISLLSDWDLDYAIAEFSYPSLRLKMEIKPLETGLEDWDIIAPADVPPPDLPVSQRRHTFTGTISNYVEKTAHILRRAFSLDGTRHFHFNKNFMTSSEFRNYLDSDGRMAQPIEFRQCVYRGGVEPKMRKEVWKHILNVYPEGMTRAEQVAYIHRKRNGYLYLRDEWQTALKVGSVSEELNKLINLVRKDVRRTDRAYKFFAGSEDNKNITSLFNILTTYGANHTSVAYCQGMSDLLSPILVIMKDEAEAYICFCALMERTKRNFSFDGHSLKTKFRHLGLLLKHYDPEFLQYLEEHEADHFFFCYRWLVLEMKREFPYEEALHVLEVMWSSLPPKPPQGELPLFEDKLTSPSDFPKSQNCAIEEISTINNSNKLFWKDDHFTCSYDNSGTSKDCAVDSDLPRHGNSRGFTDEDDAEEETLNHRFCNSCQIQNITSCKSLSCGDLQCYCPSSSPQYRHLQQAVINRSWAYSGRRCKRSWPPLEPINFDSNEQFDDINTWCLTSTVDQRRANYEAQYSRWKCPRDEINCDEEKEDEEISRYRRNDTVFTADAQRQRHGSNDSAVTCNLDDSVSVELDEDKILGSEFSKRNSPPSSTSRSRSEGYFSADGQSSKEAMSLKGIKSHSKIDDHCLYRGTVFTQEEEDHDSEGDDEGLYSETMYSESGRYFIQPHFNKKLERITYLPPPHRLGDGNPFLLFLCLTVLLQHRNVIMRSGMDCNEMAMHFEKMVRKHRAQPVLEQCREMFNQYLQLGWQECSFESCKIMEA